MKQSKGTKNRARGFTLMELLVVVSIMVILAGLTMGVMSYVNQKQAVEQAKVQLGLLELALEDYYSENGEYPPNTRDDGTGGTDEIQKALFPTTANSKIYLAELNPDNDTQGWLSGTTGNYEILDPWGEPFRYRTNRTLSNGTVRVYASNPGFDIWSCGPDGQTKTGSKGDYDPDDELNRDDIRLW
ncbi:prepilin-type N-terminal cleavage/methylation domain-containing protein [Haloferula chungangensis]|uniref:Prepilin-type N-terminal cleavage/methylation domain-containing protein n=1 Tax=Haloferula chungangensis TaxID=1048331 RepID=A0ABW2L4L5_9BACT